MPHLFPSLPHIQSLRHVTQSHSTKKLCLYEGKGVVLNGNTGFQCVA